MAKTVGACGGTVAGGTVKFTPTSRVYTLGAILCLALTVCSRYFGDRGGPYFMASLTLAGIVYLFAIREFLATPRFPRRVVVIGLALAGIWHIEFLRLPPGSDDDIHRYVWDGRLQRLGYNPYLVVPNDPAAKGLHTPETRNLNNPELPSPYPPGAQLFFRAITAVQESTFALKSAFVACDFAIVFVLLDVLRRNNQSAHLVLTFAWNPLLAIEVAGSGHIDILGALLVLVSVAALARRWRATASLALALAIAVKFLPIVLLPLYWKRIRIRDAVLGAAAVGILYVPFLSHGHIPVGSLGTYIQGFRFNGPVFQALDSLALPQALAGLALLAGLVVAIWWRRATPEWSAAVFAWPLAVALFCAPAVFPWYLLWLLPFLTSASTAVLAVWTVSVIPVYVMWHMRAISGTWGTLPPWVMLLEYGSTVVAAANTARLNRMRPEMLSSASGNRSISSKTTIA